jgi:hypothetical protein
LYGTLRFWSLNIQFGLARMVVPELSQTSFTPTLTSSELQHIYQEAAENVGRQCRG